MTEVESQVAAPAPAAVETVKEVEVDLAAQEGRKLFIGNLSFKTTSEELKEFFQGMGSVEEATIITRGTRSMGYGFVTFSAAAEASKAATELNKAELSDRQINIEVAKPKVARSSAPRAPRKRNPRRAPAGSEGADANTETAAAPVRAPRAPRQRREAPTGEPSQTMLFCANLPFGLDDTGLCDMFKGFSVTEARVVKRKNGSSKGFGFVELASNEDQQKAMAALDNADCQGRDMSVKVALNDQVPPERRAPEADAAAAAQE